MKRIIQPVQLHVSSVINAPIDAVWSLVRDFNALPAWHPSIAKSFIEQNRDGASVGCIRSFVLKGGEKVREQLLELSDSHYRFTYSILESDFGLLDYVADFSLFPITDGNRTFAVWSANFRTAPGQEAEKRTMVADGVFQLGLDTLKAHWG
jgi:hypothetical protein